MIFGAHQRRILDAGQPKEAELICRKGVWFFNLVVEQTECSPVVSDKTLGVDVGENNLATHSLGRVFGGEQLREQRARHLAHQWQPKCKTKAAAGLWQGDETGKTDKS
ncbi:hypothetical protein QPK13_20450 [Photorhabdus tasmaniensis]|uniref:hypothetical protein n=1 Tax=Photorhabdus sp. RM323S TaxID=3342828 RepID=UPI0036D8FD83